MVAGVGSTGRKLPAALSFLKNSTPGEMSSAEPPLASEAIMTPPKAAPAWVGSPLSATLPLYSGLSRSATVVGRGHDLRVVADRHVAAVVVDPQAARVLEVRGDVGERRDLVGREHRGARWRDGLPEVEDVGRGRLSLERVRGVDLVLAARVGLGGRDLDLRVLLLERVDDRAVVRPVRGQRDDVERALLVRGRDEGVHAAQRLGAGGGGRRDPAARAGRTSRCWTVGGEQAETAARPAPARATAARESRRMAGIFLPGRRERTTP